MTNILAPTQPFVKQKTLNALDQAQLCQFILFNQKALGLTTTSTALLQVAILQPNRTLKEMAKLANCSYRSANRFAEKFAKAGWCEMGDDRRWRWDFSGLLEVVTTATASCHHGNCELTSVQLDGGELEGIFYILTNTYVLVNSIRAKSNQNEPTEMEQKREEVAQKSPATKSKHSPPTHQKAKTKAKPPKPSPPVAKSPPPMDTETYQRLANLGDLCPNRNTLRKHYSKMGEAEFKKRLLAVETDLAKERSSLRSMPQLNTGTIYCALTRDTEHWQEFRRINSGKPKSKTIGVPDLIDGMIKDTEKGLSREEIVEKYTSQYSNIKAHHMEDMWEEVEWGVAERKAYSNE